MENFKLYANLHTHSTHSDGVYTPAEIAKIAYDEGYKAFAEFIADELVNILEENCEIFD